MQLYQYPFDDDAYFSWGNKHYGLPFQIWKKAYDNDKDKLIKEIVNPLMDFCCKSAFSGGLYRNSYNSLLNYERYNGAFSKLGDDYEGLYLFRDFLSPDEEQLRDFNFFWYPINRIEGELLKTPLRFSVNIVNREAGLKRKMRGAEMAAEAMARQVIAAVQNTTRSEDGTEDGVDLSFAKNKDMVVPNTMDELYKHLNDKEISSAQTYILMNHVAHKYNLKRELNSKNIRDKGIINATFGEIEVNNENDPVYQRVPPEELSWVGPDELGGRGFDDTCDAVQRTRFISATQAFTQDRGLFEGNLSTYKAIKEKIEELSKENFRQLQEQKFDIATQDKWGTFWMWRPTTGLYLCRQHIRFKMIHPCLAKITIKGKNMTEQEFEDFKNYRQNYEDVKFTVVPDDYQAKEGERVIGVPIVKMHEAIRYGDKHMVMVRESPLQLRKANNWIEVGYPFTGCIWKDKSIVTLGKDPAYLYHMAMKKLMEEVKNLSLSDVINFDVDTLPDGYTTAHIPMMLREKINLYSGAKLTTNNQSKESYKHLTTTKLSISANEFIALFNLTSIIANTFYRMLGIPMETNFIPKMETQDKNQEGPMQSSLALLPFFDEYIEEYSNQVLQKIADVGRYTWPRDKNKTVILGKGQVQTMKIDSTLPLDEQGIFVENDFKSSKDTEWLIGAAMRGMSAGSASFGEIVKMYHAKDNPEHVLAMFNEGMTTLEKLQAQQVQLKQQADANKAEIDKFKVQIPLMREDKITEREIQLQQMSDAAKKAREDAKMDDKGQLSDIDNVNKREQATHQAQLDLELATKAPKKKS